MFDPADALPAPTNGGAPHALAASAAPADAALRREPSTARPLRVAAVGDVLLVAATARHNPRADDWLSPRLRRLLSECDFVVGNLECTLAGDGGCVPTIPRVVADEACVRSVAAAGIGAVTLANNHMFDALQPGFARLRALLHEIGMPCFGAGDCAAEADAPRILEMRGFRVALLGAADDRCGVHRFAEGERWGVARLDLARLAQTIGALRGAVDHVLVSLHWGDERFAVPAPAQRAAACELVKAGASAVLGHHPHVLQGMESLRGQPIFYSLGNFVADDVPYGDNDRIAWNRTERTGCVAIMELGRAGAISGVRQIPTYDNGRCVDMDDSGFGERRLARVNRALARPITAARYRREHYWVHVVGPALKRLHPAQWSKLRFRHLAKALAAITAARRAP